MSLEDDGNEGIHCHDEVGGLKGIIARQDAEITRLESALAAAERVRDAYKADAALDAERIESLANSLKVAERVAATYAKQVEAMLARIGDVNNGN